MIDHREHYRFREELVDRLRRDLLGPTGMDADSTETIRDWPATAYALGVLFPRTRDADTLAAEAHELDHDEADSTLTVDESTDTGVTLARVRKPSALGLTFAVDPAVCASVTVTVTAAVYDPVDEAGIPTTAERAERRTTDEQGLYWRRHPLVLAPVPVDVTELRQEPRLLAPGLELRVRVRRPSQPRGVVAVTATLVNTHEITPGQIQDTFCFFQSGIRIETADGSNALVERPAPPSTDDEVILSRLLHRHAPNFATGHGCAADWRWRPPAPRNLGVQDCAPAATSALWSEFAPAHEVLLADSNPDFDVAALGMRRLADAEDADVLRALRDLTRAYADWIADRRIDASALRTHHRADAAFARVLDHQLTLCDRARQRMDCGVDLLERDPQALRAFRLANRAMATQRARTAWIKKGRVGEPVEDGVWRPFQIGFLLLCLDGITDPHHPDRQTADLLWFPTGGGKTEAYLGIIAYTTFLRRLRLGDRGAGVTVLMRYTLRLLTLQQFERASALICAMEDMRRGELEELGTKPISIGMWVGKAATPNYLTSEKDREKSAETGLRKLAAGKSLHEANPVQLRSCPWCGTALDHHAYTVEAHDRRLAIRCPNTDCAYRGGLPVHLVDEAVYHHHPTLVIATADKFAQIAWREQVAAIFNKDLDHQGTPPPELIVQDELHLISGPLGTLAGLYEAAIDLASNRPKVIASTATIRRAQDQGKALFDRPRVAQFPPAGIDARDSWFAVEAPKDKKATRRYVGLLAPCTSQATLLVRAYAALLHHAAVIPGDDVRDAYWTLVGYFNSLRLLAAAELQVRDDVHQRLELLAGQAGLPDRAREVDQLTELTSRVASSRIPDKLKELETGLPKSASDVVLATNMISVGVDVDRLGLMAVLGQPQTTAEYIQATSRVGRLHPGLVVTLFNSARSRDRSHYEGFIPYHSALYRQVESTSVTPFSPRARDRALHAAFIGLARLTIPDARPNAAAADVKHYADRLLDLRDALVARARHVDPAEADHVAREIDWIIEDWCAFAADNPSLVYEAPRRRRPGEKRPADTALLRAHNDEDLTEAIDTMWSYRDVDVESDLYLEA
ncbi:helicase-related protein [Streptomyces canus]|uniref:helicase-related protein n=1 Tax=Streptomyces canus TaxID=58343 RepID=UPI002E2DCDD5|nr:helicase-related protein [Streptomyces canus]